MCRADGIGARAGVPTSGPTRSGSRARQLYLKYCAQCHGEKGDGEGYATPHLLPRPRNFTTGKFKVRTTPNGALPTHQDLVNIIRRGMPYTSMPAWPDLSDQEVSDLAHFITTFSPDFSNAENAPKPVELPSAPNATNESIELGKKLYEETGCVKCHGTLGRGDGPSAPTLMDDWGHPIRAADLAQSWTFRGGSSREDIFRTMSTGLNGTPMPSFADALTPEQRWAITDFIVSLSGSNGPGYTNLVVAKHVRDPIDLAKGAASFASAPVARFPIVGQIMEPGRAFHPPATTVDRSGDLRRRVDRPPRSMARHERGEDREERAVASRAAGRGRGAGSGRSRGRGRRRSGNPFGDAEVAPAPGRQDGPAAAPIPLRRSRRRRASHPSSPTPSRSRFLRRCRRAPASPTSSSATARTRWISGSSIWPAPTPLQFTGQGSADIAPERHGGSHRRRELRPGRMVGHLQAAASPQPRAPRSRPEQFLPVAFSVWDGFSRERGNRRGLTPWYSLYVEPEVVPSAVGPMVRTALLILVIELAVIGWVRWRYGSRAAELGGEPRHPAATSV